MSRLPVVLGAPLLLVIAGTASIAATADESPMPRLGDHVFVPAMILVEPFITTFAQTSVSLGSTTNASFPIIDPVTGDVLGTAHADRLYAGIGFRYQHAAKDWLAVRLRLSTVGAVGTSTTSLVAEGITGSVGYNIGWQMRIHRSERFLLSGTVSLGNRRASFINLVDWVDGILSGVNVPLVRARQSLIGGGGVHAGWGVSRRFGLLGSLEAVYGESFDGKGKNAWSSDTRLALSYDLRHDIEVPLGLVLGGGFYENDTSSNTQEGVWFWSVRLAAQGRRDFTIGLDLVYSYFDSYYRDETVILPQFSIDMRYFY
jgi:hypothetical protein